MRRLIALALACMLAACATRAPHAGIELPPLRLPPAALGHDVAAQQRLHFAFGAQQREMDALLEVEAGEVRLAVQAMGQTGVRLRWDGKELTQQRAPWLPSAVRAERVLDDLQFALWPADAIRRVLPPTWTLREAGNVRELLRDDTVWLSMEKSEDGRIHLHNRAEGYRLDIESVDSGGVP
ncbi:MAG: DUF3261 domain-containing protein [Thermomonas sp.]|uniref:DUF3261 domain-containing protein n=1 Tax=Thermomonas sp. TaxID=1971895 RepID=UPI0039E23299